MTLSHELNETVTVTVGVLGRAETALGTATIHQTVVADDVQALVQQVGELVGAAYRAAYVEAVHGFMPDMRKHWADQGIRAQDTEDGTTSL